MIDAVVAAQRAAGHHGPAAPSHGAGNGGGCRTDPLVLRGRLPLSLRATGSRIKWSLGPTEGLLIVLGHPERHFPAIHIAGTNGKGSTCAFTATELRARLKVGVYTSPHLGRCGSA